MTELFILDFHGTEFAVPKSSLSSHEVQSSVPVEIFEIFVNTGTDLEVMVTQTGKNHSHSHSLAFSCVEIFGTLSRGRFPLKEANSLDGIISYLTRKYEGNVHDKGIVTITSKSVWSNDPKLAVRNVADLTSKSHFFSKDEPGQWVCWDFHEIRVRPTHYTIRTALLKSWVVESSLEGKAWTEIDQKTDNDDFKSGNYMAASFAVSNSAECRFIRLTQTAKDHGKKDDLGIRAFEFFGTLFE
jgi:hypothetical protein